MKVWQRFWRRRRFGAPIVVVSGLPRSGTSMVMRMLKAGGVPTVEDDRRQADPDNPVGYFEDERVKSLGEDNSWVREVRGKAVKVVSYLLRDLPADNNYKVILLERDLSEVLASQAKMLERRGESDSVSDEKMTENYRSLILRTNYLIDHSPHFDALRVRYPDVIANPGKEAARIAEFLGGGLDVEGMTAAVDENLYRNRAPERSPPSSTG